MSQKPKISRPPLSGSFALEWSIARRYLSSRKRDKFISLTAVLSVTSIALGVAALIAVMSVMNGFREELLSKILGYQGHMLVNSYGDGFAGAEDLSRQIEAVDGVARATPFTENQVMVTRDDRARGAIVRGFPHAMFTEGRLNIKTVLAGDPAAAVELGGVVMGYELAARLGVRIGDDVTIVSPQAVDTPFGSQLRYLAFPVVAIVELGIFQYDQAFIGMPMADAQRFFRYGNAVPLIDVRLFDPQYVRGPLAAVQTLIGSAGLVRSWQQFNQVYVNALQTERVAMFLILSIIIVVAVFNIASSLFMLVKEKASDIAILKTMGLSSAAIMRIFIMVGLTVGLSGVVAGCLLAWAIVGNIDTIKTAIELALGLDLWDPSVRLITELKASVDPGEVIATIALATSLSFLAALLPARRAASIDPVEVLRYE